MNTAEEALPLWKSGRITGYATIDSEDFVLASSFHWFEDQDGYVRATVYDSDGQTSKPVFLHRVIVGTDASMEVDHIDRNPLNNRKSNLRLTTRAQNAQNKALINNQGSSKYRGVYFHKGAQKWMAYSQVDHKRVYLGLHLNEEDAARAASDWRKANMTHTTEEIL